MAKIRDKVMEHNALKDAVHRILERGRQMGKDLKQGSLEVMTGAMIDIVEEKKSFFSREKNILVIGMGIYTNDSHQREICCRVCDPSLLDMIKEELQKYADACDVESILLEQGAN